jgi:hypothetical protein
MAERDRIAEFKGSGSDLRTGKAIEVVVHRLETPGA